MDELDYFAKINKARGSFLGLAIGDALGHPYEFDYSSRLIREEMDVVRHMHDINQDYGFNFSAELKGNWTDDTSMALCLADSLIEKNGYDSYDIMEKFSKWFFEGYRTFFPIGFGVGTQTADALLTYQRNKIIKKDSEKSDSIGNGCIMRLTPIVLANYDNDPDEVIYAARLSCRETHDSIGAIAITELMAASLYLLLHGSNKKDLLTKSMNLVKDKESITFLNSVQEFHNAIESKKGDELCDLGGYALDCYNIAMWGLINFDSFMYGMLGVIGLGGDTDTNAAVYGQLAGAYYGYDLIPEEWIKDVYLGNEITKLADKLVEIGKYKILRTRFEDERKFSKESM